jgi:hypothetical protein
VAVAVEGGVKGGAGQGKEDPAACLGPLTSSVGTGLIDKLVQYQFGTAVVSVLHVHVHKGQPEVATHLTSCRCPGKASQHWSPSTA